MHKPTRTWKEEASLSLRAYMVFIKKTFLKSVKCHFMVFLTLRYIWPIFHKVVGHVGVFPLEYPHRDTLSKTDFHKVAMVRVAWMYLQVSTWNRWACLNIFLMYTSSEYISLMPVVTDGFNALVNWAKFTLFGLSCTYKLLPAWMSVTWKKSCILNYDQCWKPHCRY